MKEKNQWMKNKDNERNVNEREINERKKEIFSAKDEKKERN